MRPWRGEVAQGVSIEYGEGRIERFPDNTGQDNRDIDLAATEAGAADFIPKSEITTAQLEQSVRFALAMNSQKRQLLDMTRALEKAKTIALTNAQALEQTQIELR